MAAQVCVYAVGDDGGRVPRAFVLRRFAASQLTRLLRDSVSSHTRGGTDCVSDPVVFRLRTGSGDVVSVTAAGCELASGQNAAVVTPAAGEDLGALDAVRLDPPYRASPDVLGQPLGAARRAERRQRWGVEADWEWIDASLPFGTIVWQYPLPGALQDADVQEVGVAVAVRLAPACRGSQLRGQYQENSPLAGGARNGAIGLYNTTVRPCSLSGVVRIVGGDRQRRRVTGAVSFRAHKPIILSRARGDMPSLNAGTPAFDGQVRGNVVRPLGETCAHFVLPTTWLLTFGDHQHVSVANHDPRAEPGDADAFFSCRGNIASGHEDLVFFQGL